MKRRALRCPLFVLGDLAKCSGKRHECGRKNTPQVCDVTMQQNQVPAKGALSQKSEANTRYGLAAGCEAVAPPRRDGPLVEGYPLVWACPSAATDQNLHFLRMIFLPKRAKPEPEAQPGDILVLNGGAQPPPHIRRQSRTASGFLDF